MTAWIIWSIRLEKAECQPSLRRTSYRKERNIMKRIQQQTLDQERALYGMKDIEVVDCAFDGPADGESA